MLGVFVVDCSELALNHIYIFPLQYFEDESVVDFKRDVRAVCIHSGRECKPLG
jgi:hypothetical protein